MKKTNGIATMIGSAAALAIALAALRVWAAGIPNSNALTYSGVLEDATGELIAGTHDIEVRFWSAASTGSMLCATSAEDMELQNGRFSVALLDECTDAVHGASDVWVEIIVDATSLGRSKVGAVPYAVEADRAVVAESAAVADTADRLGTLTPASVQQRISGTCSAGSSIRSIGTDGTVACEDDSVLTESQVDAYASNNGYALATDLSAKQNRVSGACAAGQSIRAIASDGTVTCEADDTASYTAGNGLTLAGTSFSADTTYVQRRVSATCAVGQAIRAISADGTVACEADDNTTYSAGTGLSLNGTTFSAAPLDTRISTLEEIANGVGAVVQGSASTTQDAPSSHVNFVYSHVTVTLTPGTWLVQGFAGLITTDVADAVQLSLYNVTTGQEVPNARSAPGTTVPYSSPGTGVAAALSTSRTLEVTANTSLRLYAIRNGGSWLRVVGSGDAAYLTQHARIMATRLK